MEQYKLVRHREFDLAYGKENVWYSLHEYSKGLFGKFKWQAVKAYYFDTGGGSMSAVRGEINWAKSIAKELKIEVPKQ